MFSANILSVYLRLRSQSWLVEQNICWCLSDRWLDLSSRFEFKVHLIHAAVNKLTELSFFFLLLSGWEHVCTQVEFKSFATKRLWQEKILKFHDLSVRLYYGKLVLNDLLLLPCTGLVRGVIAFF